MTGAALRPDWIAVDWGTTHLRAWAVGASGILAEARTTDGMVRLEPDAFEPALISLIGDWLSPDVVTPVIACGMVGARQGWAEASYRPVPCLADHAGILTTAPSQDPRISVGIVPGLMQDRPADVMRGEETQIMGFLAGNPDFDGVLCLPGTHSKWVHVSAREVVSFQTFLTGELFALLSNQSVLRHSVGVAGWNDRAFAEALAETLSRPERIAARLFSLRAETLLHGLDPASARARLSGLLIGIELAAARPYWLGQDIVIIGADGLSDVYATALGLQGLVPQRADGPMMTLAGLAKARAGEREILQ